MTLPRWDLSNVYPGLESPEFKNAMSKLAALLDDLDRFLDIHGIGRRDQSEAVEPV